MVLCGCFSKLAWTAATWLAPLLLLYHGLRFALTWLRRWQRGTSNHRRVIGLFHPYCNAGGGGERVLWCIVKYLETNFPEWRIVIYSGDTDATPAQILAKMRTNFNIDLKKEPEFVFLRGRTLVEARHYPLFTLLLQSLASSLLGLEALLKCVPDIYMDTMGYSFTYWLFKLAGCKVACYTHYPTISTDMITVVQRNAATFNNRAWISQSRLLTTIKLVYYQLFALLYALAGRISNCIMVNSSWTRNHIVELWGDQSPVQLVYPPCNTSHFDELPATRSDDCRYRIVSVAQFRPEKNHALQLHAMHKLLNKLNPEERPKAKLTVVGSCRGREDEQRVEMLRKLAAELGITENVEFSLNFSFERLLDIVRSSSIGLHTMSNEHFGISVVENIAGGLIMLANNSGGPQMDIIDEGRTGFLASTADEYAERLLDIVRRSADELDAIRRAGRERMHKFSDEAFQKRLSQILDANFMS